jgi:hypothetical protein
MPRRPALTLAEITRTLKAFKAADIGARTPPAR